MAFSALPAGASGVEELLENYCYSCLDEWEKKGDLQLDLLETLPLESRLDLLNKACPISFMGIPSDKGLGTYGVSTRVTVP